MAFSILSLTERDIISAYLFFLFLIIRVMVIMNISNIIINNIINIFVLLSSLFISIVVVISVLVSDIVFIVVDAEDAVTFGENVTGGVDVNEVKEVVSSVEAISSVIVCGCVTESILC